MLSGCLRVRDHVRVPGGSDAAGGSGRAGPSIGPALGSAVVVPGVPADPGSRSWPGATGSLAAAPARPGPGCGLGATVGRAGAVPVGPGSRFGTGVPAGPGSRYGADSAAGAACGCPGSEPVTGAAASAAGSPVSCAAPAWLRRVSRAATARSRARPAPALPRGPPPARLPGSGRWPGAAAGAGERIASKSGAASPASGGSSVMRRPRQEIRARARPDRHPGPRR
jgi:hypothetical protein